MWVLFAVNAGVFLIISIGAAADGEIILGRAAAVGWAVAAVCQYELRKEKVNG